MNRTDRRVSFLRSVRHCALAVVLSCGAADGLAEEPALAGPGGTPYVNTWTKQFGTSGTDQSNGVSADGLGNVYISGFTEGALGGPNAGLYDAFVSKYTAAGTLLWTKQLGLISYDLSNGVSADKLGNVFISGYTYGALGGPYGGNGDAFVSKYNAAGTLQWTKQLSTNTQDISFGAAADGLGNVFITGRTEGALSGTYAGDTDAFVSKYNAAGTLQWTKQFGTSNHDVSRAVSSDGSGNVFISGYTNSPLGGPNAGGVDAFVSKYDAAGTLQWTKQLGTSSDDEGYGVATDALGNVFITGSTFGALGGTNAGGTDAFVSKYNTAGTLQWTKQLGTSGTDYSFGASADGLGNVFITGYTASSLGGTNAGLLDAFVSMYDTAGTLLWTKQLGTSTDDVSYSVSADGSGNVFIAGSTLGALGGPNAGGYDAFVARYSNPDVVPEPSTWLAGIVAVMGLGALRLRRG